MPTEPFALLCLDVFIEKKPKFCAGCGYFNRDRQPCKLDYYSTAKTRVCSQAISRKALIERGY